VLFQVTKIFSNEVGMKFKVYAKIIILNLLFFFLCSTAISYEIQAKANFQTNNSISGFVFGNERRPVSEVRVELLDEYNRSVFNTRTDGAGRYSFYRLSQGRYSVRVLPLGTGYEEQTRDVEIVNITRQSGGRTVVSASDNIQQNFYLQLKRNADNVPVTNGVIFAQDIPKEAQKIYQKAVSDLNEKKVEEGLIELKKAIEIFPDYYLALTRLGQEYITQQKYEEARNVLGKAVTINSKDYESQYALGYSLYKLNSHTEAVEALKKSLEINQVSVNGLFLLGINLKQLGKYEEAVVSLKKAEKLANPPLPDIHWQLSLLYTNNLKNYSAAADELELFLKASPDFEEAAKVRALINTLRAKGKK